VQIGACLIDESSRIVAADADLAKRCGSAHPGSMVHGDSLRDHIDSHAAQQCLSQVFAGAEQQSCDAILLCTGKPQSVRLEVIRLDGPFGPLALVLIHRRGFKDFDTTDSLTGLPERRAILAQVAAWRESGDLSFALLFLDLDDFKAVNDSHGHAAGDQALHRLADRWQRCLRESDLVARYGGDEFVILLKDIASPRDAQPVVDRLKSATAEPIAVGALTINLSATIGVAIADAPDVSLEDLLHAADLDMYAHKPSRPR
jgi:diguanylate cyclase (GGDEF)-like protein